MMIVEPDEPELSPPPESGSLPPPAPQADRARTEVAARAVRIVRFFMSFS
jgi:hypothetical protein